MLKITLALGTVAAIGAILGLLSLSEEGSPSSGRFLAAAETSEEEQDFIAFINIFRRQYNSNKDYNFRFGVFKKNLNKINQHA